MSNTPITQIQLRRGTSSQWNSSSVPLAEGELGYATDSGELRIGKSGGSLWSVSNAAGGSGTGASSTFPGPVGAVGYSSNGTTLTGSSRFRYFSNTGFNGGQTGILLVDGDLCVKGTIDPISIILTPSTTNPNPGINGSIWFDANSGTLQNGSVGPIGSGIAYTGSTGPTGTGVTGVTGPTGYSGVPTGGTTGYVLTKRSEKNYDTIWSAPSGGASITTGFYQVAFASSSTFSTTHDTTGFLSSIGTWSQPTSTTITLTFNSTYSSTTIPPYFGGYIGFWFNSQYYKILNINGPTAASNPIVSLVRSGSNWVWTMTINGSTFTTSGNNATYGFFLVMNMFN